MSYACLLIQCQRTDEAVVILRDLAAKGFETVKVNILISLAYRMASEQDNENGAESDLAEKYRSLAYLH